MPAGGHMGRHMGMLCRKGKVCASARRREKTLAPCGEKYQVMRERRPSAARSASCRCPA
jgi:hypothetical protein